MINGRISFVCCATFVVVFGLACCLWCGCINKNRSIISGLARTVSSPASICIAINQARPELLRVAGERLFDQSILFEWSQERINDELYALHHADDVLKGLVGADDLAWSECRVATMEYYDAISGAHNDIGAIGYSLAKLAIVFDEISDALSVYGIDSIFRFCNETNKEVGTTISVFIGVLNTLKTGGEMDNKATDAIDLLIRALAMSRPVVTAVMERNGHTSSESKAYLALGYIGVEYLSKIWSAYKNGKSVDIEKLMGTPPSNLWRDADINNSIEPEINVIKRHHREVFQKNSSNGE